MHRFSLPDKYKKSQKPLPVLVKVSSKNKFKFRLPRVFKSNKIKLLVSVVAIFTATLPAVLIMPLFNQSQQAEANIIQTSRSTSRILIENFNNVDFHKNPDSNITITNSLISLNTDTCKSITQPTDTNCRLLFYPNQNNLQAEIGSLIKSLNLNSKVAADSRIVIEHVDINEVLISKLGEISSNDTYKEINLPLSFDSGQAIKMVFWNKIVNSDGPSSTSPSTTSNFGRYCNVEYKIINAWNRGYTGSIKITNMTNKSITDWELSYSLSGSHEIDSMWNGKTSRNGSNMRINPESWTRNINPNGGFVEIGFNGSYTGQMVQGTDFRLNGFECNKDVNYGFDGISCRVEYRIINDWGSGFTGSIKVFNLGTKAITDWNLKFNFPESQSVYESWGATTSQSGKQVSMSSVDYTRTINAGGFQEIGFNASYPLRQNNPVTSFKLNDTDCTAQRSYRYGIEISSFSLKYLQYDRLLSVVVAITTSDMTSLDLSTAKVYYDLDRDQRFNSNFDVLWECRDKFPGVNVGYSESAKILQLTRDDSCFGKTWPESWDTNKVAIPPGNWLIVIEDGKRVIPFALADDGSTTIL